MKNQDERIKPTGGHIHIVIGASRFGSQVALLHAKMGRYITVIDKNPNSFYKLGDNFPGSFVCGDATKISTLEEANAIKGKSILVATNSDDVNIYIANLLYLVYGKVDIVVRIDDETKHDLLESKSIKIINPYISSINAYLNVGIGD